MKRKTAADEEASPESELQNEEPTVEPEDETAPEGDIDEENEDLPTNPLPRKHVPKLHDEEGCHCYDSTFPKGKLPPPPILKQLEPEEKPKPKHGKDGVDKAMEILDEYYEDVPLRNPHVDHGGED